MENDIQYNQRRKTFNMISLVVCAVIFIVVTILLWKPLTETFTNPEEFRQWISGQGFWGQFVISGMMILQIVFALIPGGPMEVAAGYAFGAIEETILCVIGGMIGTAIIFMRLSCLLFDF